MHRREPQRSTSAGLKLQDLVRVVYYLFLHTSIKGFVTHNDLERVPAFEPGSQEPDFLALRKIWPTFNACQEGHGWLFDYLSLRIRPFTVERARILLLCRRN
jgi:hypothetical protein